MATIDQMVEKLVDERTLVLSTHVADLEHRLRGLEAMSARTYAQTAAKIVSCALARIILENPPRGRKTYLSAVLAMAEKKGDGGLSVQERKRFVDEMRKFAAFAGFTYSRQKVDDMKDAIAVAQRLCTGIDRMIHGDAIGLDEAMRCVVGQFRSQT